MGDTATVIVELPSTITFVDGVLDTACYAAFAHSGCHVLTDSVIFTVTSSLTGTNEFWIVASLKAPDTSAATDYFKVSSYWGSERISPPEADDYSGQKVLSFTTPAAFKSTGLALDVWPNQIGETARYQFTLTLDDSTTLEAAMPLWIFFDNTLYDYYVGEAINQLPDEEDDDGMPIYYVPCEAFVRADAADELTTDVADYCVARRHRIEVHITSDVAETEILDIRLINMYNPEPSAAVTYLVIAMNYSHVGAEDAMDEALYYWSVD